MNNLPCFVGLDYHQNQIQVCVLDQQARIRANGHLRAVIIQAAHRLIRTHARWRELARRLGQVGKPPSVVVAAVANRWVRSMHHRMVATAQTEVAEPKKL
jgi:hypothetical protein